MFRDITREAGITFQHHAAPEKKYIVESMSGGVALFDYDNDGRLDIYFVDSLTVDTAGDPKQARSALYRNCGKAQVRGRHRQGRRRPSRLGHGRLHRRRRRRRLGGSLRHRARRQQALSQQSRRHVQRRRRRAPASPAAAGRPGCGFADYDRDGDLDLFVSRYVKIDLQHLPQFGTRQDLRVPRHRGAVRPARPAGRVRFSLPQRRQRAGSPRSARQAGVADPSGYFGLGVAWFDYNEDGWPDLYVANDSTPNFLYRTRRTARSRRSRFRWAWRSARTAPSRAAWVSPSATTTTPDASALFVTNFSEEYNALYHNDGRSLHRRVVPIEDRGHQPAVRRLGDGVLRLRQRRAARPDRRQRPRLPAARQSEARRVGGLPSAQAALPQSRRRHVRRSGGAVRRR